MNRDVCMLNVECWTSAPVRFDERPVICLDLSLTLEGVEVCPCVVVYLPVVFIEGSSNQSEFERRLEVRP